MPPEFQPPTYTRSVRWETTAAGTGFWKGRVVLLHDPAVDRSRHGQTWRRDPPSGPARLLRVSVVGNGHVRAIAAGDDGKSFKLIAFRAADTPLGHALLAATPEQRFWLAGTIKRDEWNGGNAAEMHLEDAAFA